MCVGEVWHHNCIHGFMTCTVESLLRKRKSTVGWCPRSDRRGRYWCLRGWMVGDWRKLHNEELSDFVFLTKYRVCINCRRVSLRHNLSRKCRKIVKLVSITHSEGNIWYGPMVATAGVHKRTPARSMGWSCSGHRQHLLLLTTSITRPNRVISSCRVSFKDNVYVPPLP
jgi:hypothetical protein